MELAAIKPTGPVARMGEICLAKLRQLWRAQKQARTLAVRETATLGERRMVAVVECGRQRFLVGASPGSVTMLAKLEDGDAAGDEK